MSPSHTSISLIKQSNMSKERLTIFLLNVPKEALFNYLNESKILSNPTRLSKNKMIEWIVNDGVLKIDKEISILPINTEKMRMHDK